MESLKALVPGWFDQTGTAFEPAQLDWLSKLLTVVLDEFQLPRPYIYPRPEGSVRAEWSGTRWEVSVDFALDVQQASALAACVDSDEQHELWVPLGENGSKGRLGRFLQEHG